MPRTAVAMVAAAKAVTAAAVEGAVAAKEPEVVMPAGAMPDLVVAGMEAAGVASVGQMLPAAVRAVRVATVALVEGRIRGWAWTIPVERRSLVPARRKLRIAKLG